VPWLLAGLLLAGCQGDTPAPALTGAQATPPLDRSASLLGPDTNANGIRDDIEAWIDSRNDRTAAQKDAMRQYARALQARLVASRTPEAALAAARVSERAHNCLRVQSRGFDDYAVQSRLLEDYTLNTRDRVLASHAIGRLLSGQSWNLSNGDTCENAP
jgi:hypothetical protein